MPLFDAHIFVDWSAKSVPGPVRPARDAIWVGERPSDRGSCETYHRTRAAATEYVRGRLRSHVREGRRVLVGFDFPYGYPEGLPRALGLGGADPWRAMWDLLAAEVTDDEKNRNNRFEVASELNRCLGGGPGPFWGRPPAAKVAHLGVAMKGLFQFPFAASGWPLQRLRRTEQRLNGMPGIGAVQETWKLMGAGSVGSQALVGLPRVHDLRFDEKLDRGSRVWPFETGFTATPAPERGPWVLHAEIWPGIVPAKELAEEMAGEGEGEPTPIPDRAQVRLMCRWAARHDAEGTLGGWFDAPTLDGAERTAAEAEEGWVLGCPA